jgi:hypothetical protein
MPTAAVCLHRAGEVSMFRQRRGRWRGYHLRALLLGQAPSPHGNGRSVGIPQVLLITRTLPHRVATVLVRCRLIRSRARDDVGFEGSRRDYASALTTSIIRGMCSCRNSMSLVVSGAFRPRHTVPLLVTAVDSR